LNLACALSLLTIVRFGETDISPFRSRKVERLEIRIARKVTYVSDSEMRNFFVELGRTRVLAEAYR
jgi:hypothetical protein